MFFFNVFETHRFEKRWQEASLNTAKAEQAEYRWQILISERFFVSCTWCLQNHFFGSWTSRQKSMRASSEALGASKSSQGADGAQAEPSLRVSSRDGPGWRSTAGSRLKRETPRTRKTYNNDFCSCSMVVCCSLWVRIDVLLWLAVCVARVSAYVNRYFGPAADRRTRRKSSACDPLKHVRDHGLTTTNSVKHKHLWSYMISIESVTGSWGSLGAFWSLGNLWACPVAIFVNLFWYWKNNNFKTPGVLTKMVSSIEHCHRPWCSLHPWLVPNEFCALFGVWKALGSCPGEIFVAFFLAFNHMLFWDTPCDKHIETPQSCPKTIFEHAVGYQPVSSWGRTCREGSACDPLRHVRHNVRTTTDAAKHWKF